MRTKMKILACSIYDFVSNLSVKKLFLILVLLNLLGLAIVFFQNLNSNDINDKNKKLSDLQFYYADLNSERNTNLILLSSYNQVSKQILDSWDEPYFIRYSNDITRNYDSSGKLIRDGDYWGKIIHLYQMEMDRVSSSTAIEWSEELNRGKWWESFLSALVFIFNIVAIPVNIFITLVLGDKFKKR